MSYGSDFTIPAAAQTAWEARFSEIAEDMLHNDPNRSMARDAVDRASAGLPTIIALTNPEETTTMSTPTVVETHRNGGRVSAPAAPQGQAPATR
jgi:hypothetical protein